MDIKDSIGERLGRLMKHYGLNKNSLTVKIGLSSNSVIGRIVNDHSRTPSFDLLKEIAIQFPEVNIRWLVTGEGDMLGKELAAKGEKGEINYYKIIPGESFLKLPDKPTAVLITYGFADCEIGFDVFGDSMVPRFKQGDLILCSNHYNKSIQIGEPYMLVINGVPIIRYIKNVMNNTNYKLSSENPRYEDYEVKILDVEYLYLIKAIIRREVF